MSRPPLRFVFGLHLHQPVGNFDHIFADHLRGVYRPIIERSAAAGFLPLTVHLSGPLLEWLDQHEPAFLDLLGELAAAGRLELLAAGFDEPILLSLPRADRLEQVGRMREYLQRRLGVDAVGAWLTERVWAPELASDLVRSGVRYALLDDRHFLVTGFTRDQLHRPFRTESDGHTLALLAIDERLRYLVPFGPPEDTATYLRELREQGHALAVLADDGEKFGGWPGTKDWVYDRGWLASFFEVIGKLVENGEVVLSTGAEAVREIPSAGLAYLPTASYREMEAWALPAPAQQRLARLEEQLGPGQLAAGMGSLVRGGHWRHFLVKYAESNRMQKLMVAISALCRLRGDPPVPRRAIGRAQCNDAYWHGVFGGLYLPHLRRGLWRQLAIAERELRAGEALAHDVTDLDCDGHDEIWVHSAHFSAVVSPWRGGTVETFMKFAAEENLADTLTRRREAYHDPDELPPADPDLRALLVDRMLPGYLSLADWSRASFTPLASWAGEPMVATVRELDGEQGRELEIHLAALGLTKVLRFTEIGGIKVRWTWDPAAFPGDAWFTTELSLARDLELDAPADTWRFPIATMAKSERGLEETEQGISVTPRWPMAAGQAELRVPE